MSQRLRPRLAEDVPAPPAPPPGRTPPSLYDLALASLAGAALVGAHTFTEEDLGLALKAAARSLRRVAAAPGPSTDADDVGAFVRRLQADGVLTPVLGGYAVDWKRLPF